MLAHDYFSHIEKALEQLVITLFYCDCCNKNCVDFVFKNVLVILGFSYRV